MQKTRNLFVLKGNKKHVLYVLRRLKFKGLSTIKSSQISISDILNAFYNNKSVVCISMPKVFENQAIQIPVINTTSNAFKDCINIASKKDLCLQFLEIANRYNCDIGDNNLDNSKLKDASSIANCPYCRYFKNNTPDEQLNLKRTIYQSQNFVVVLAAKEFIKGYLLIIPTCHISSITELSPELRQELLNVLNDVTTILKLTYHISNILVWENGIGKDEFSRAKNSIGHSYFHVAPSQLTAEKIQVLSGFLLTKISYNELFSFGEHSYLLLKGKSNNEWYINDTPDLYIPKQYVRQLLAQEYGFDDSIWNSGADIFKNLIKSTYVDIQNALTKNWNTLTTRIQKNTKKFLF